MDSADAPCAPRVEAEQSITDTLGALFVSFVVNVCVGQPVSTPSHRVRRRVARAAMSGRG
jgi:hypothetical protein